MMDTVLSYDTISELPTVRMPVMERVYSNNARLLANFPELAYDFTLATALGELCGMSSMELVQSTIERFGGAK